MDDENENEKVSKNIFIKHGHVLKRLRLNEIVWIKSDGNYCTFSLVDKKHVLKISLTRVLDGLPRDAFVQIHRSYAVRIDQITSIDIHENLIFIDGVSLPIGRKYKESFLARINLI